MSKIKPERAYAKKIFDGFEGVSAIKSLGEGRLRAVSNFRVREDGVLEKRCGYRTYATFPAPVRGFWQGTVGGFVRSFAVCEGTVFLLTNGVATSSTDIATSEGTVSFFLYSDTLFLLDGTYVYAFDTVSLRFEKTDGYAPLYGRNWHPTDYGDVYEDLNLFSPKLRIHYANTTGATEFHLPFYARSVDKVRVDNRTANGYYLNAAGDILTIPTVGASVEVAFTMETEGEDQEMLYQCTHAFADRIKSRERLILYGTPSGHRLFCASAVSDSMISFCKVFYPDATPLYFKNEGIVTVGAPESPVTTLYRDHDRVLAFHPMGASSISFDADGDQVTDYPLLQGIGCCVEGVNLSPEGDPILLNERGVLQISSTASEPDMFSIKDLSAGLPEVKALCAKRQTTVFHDPAHGELWLRDPDDTRGLVWVLRLSGKEWYCFESIRATFFCRIDGMSGFADGEGSLLLFDDDLCSDEGEPIQAYFKTDHLSFSSPELPKRGLRVALCGEERGVTQLSLETERGTQNQLIAANGSSSPDLIDVRSAPGRFRFLRVCVSDTGCSRARYHRLALYANL